MANRINSVDVTRILSTTLGETEIDAFIGDVELWVTEELSGFGLSAGRLATIEKYLVCAFVRIRDLGLKSVSMAGSSESYQVDPNVSDYLLRAAAMDPTGTVQKQFIDTQSPKTPVKFMIGTTFTCERASSDRGMIAGGE